MDVTLWLITSEQDSLGISGEDNKTLTLMCRAVIKGRLYAQRWLEDESKCSTTKSLPNAFDNLALYNFHEPSNQSMAMHCMWPEKRGIEF